MTTSSIPNPALAALAPNQNGIVNYPDGGSFQGLTVAPLNCVVWLQGSNHRYVSSEGGYQAMTCARSVYGAWEQFTVEAAAGGKVALHNGFTNHYVSGENGTQAMTCTHNAAGPAELFDWLINPDGTVSLRGSNGAYVSGENGVQPMTCTRTALATTEKFLFGVVGGTALASKTSRGSAAGFYPNPVTGTLTYQLPAGVAGHRLSVFDTTGREVLSQSFSAVGEQHSVDLTALRPGLYLVRLVGDGFHSEFNISKQ